MSQGRGGSALNEEEKRMIESEDFDFEANLAMFDKEREMQVIPASHWSILLILASDWSGD